MMTKCIVLFLAVFVGQTVASECKQPRSCDFNSRSGFHGIAADCSQSYDYEEPILRRLPSRHVFPKGKYPVVLKPPMPSIERRIPVTTTHITTPVQEKPIIHLPANIPKPRTISHTCTCYHTILTPKVDQGIINVPSIDRYVQTVTAPLIQKFHFPCLKSQQCVNSGIVLSSLNAESSSAAAAAAAAAAGIQTPGISALEFPSMQYPRRETVRSVQVPQVQVIEIPQVQSFQVPGGQTFESGCYSGC